MRVEQLESRLLLHAGDDHAAPSSSSSPPVIPDTLVVPEPAPVSVAAVGDEMLPDMIPLVSQDDEYVYGWTIDVTEIPGRILLRLTTAMANRGRGPMELNGGDPLPDGTQEVFQKINLEGGGSTSRVAGQFIYHPAHEHVHFDNFAQYRLRQVTAGNGVGDVTASGDKISFCLLDIDHFNASLPGSPAFGRYNDCGQIQGVSVGWADVYDQMLPDQWIDVTDVPDGPYWLEVVADPDNRLRETDETNNAARILITLDKPSPDPLVVAHNPVGQYPAPASAVEFLFDQPMNTGSFSVADDVLRFSGPGGTNLVGQITGFSWPDSRTLRVAFATQSGVGAYSMTIGPNILANDNGAPMDQDRDEIPGEPGQDTYNAGFNVDNRIGPDAFGYEARAVPFENIDLVRGAAGVFVVVDNVDDGIAPVNLGANTFNFYGVNYSGGASLYVSSNGLITLGGSTAAYGNGDLTTDPTQGTIAVLWDDLRTDQSSADVVLGRFEDTTGDGLPDRLIIEWNDVRRHSDPGPAPAVNQTFQAILSLNTGANPGAMVFNYRDLDTGSPFANGADATVGIKAGGNQTALGRRLLVSLDRRNHPFVATGKAIRIAGAPATIVGRHLFYNDSVFDGSNPAAGTADDAAIAPDKLAFIPRGGPSGGSATFDNLSSYSRGINGLMVDIAGLFGRTPVASDFEVTMGNGPLPGNWVAAPAPAVSLRRGAGDLGSDRVTLVWPDDAVRNTWLRVGVRPTSTTNLALGDVFYFGHLAGETGDASSVGPSVGPADLFQTRGAMSTAAVTLTSRHDHNRNGRVDAGDIAITRANQRASLTWLESPLTAADGSANVVPTRAARNVAARRTGFLLDEPTA